MYSVLMEILDSIWFVLPAYIANATPVVVAKIIKVRHPVDMGRKFIDGKRIFGDSKSWEGFLFGILTGTATGFIQCVAVGGATAILIRGFLLSLGAMLGDLLGAFIKRRLGLPPGSPAPVLDQLSFLAMALLIVYAANLYTLSIPQTLFIVILTLALHFLTNAIAYLLKLKEVPW